MAKREVSGAARGDADSETDSERRLPAFTRFGLIGLVVVFALGSTFYLVARSNSGTLLSAFVSSLTAAEDSEDSGGPQPSSSRVAGSSDGRAQATDGRPSSGSGPSDEALARPGTEIAVVETPPESTLSALSVPEGFTKASYKVEFEPYGWGPGGADAGYLVIRIVEAQRGAGAEGLPDLSGRNAIVSIDGRLAEPVTEGSRYAGGLEVRSDTEGRGGLYLQEFTPAR